MSTKNMYYSNMNRGSGGMAYTGDLKSPAEQACGFKSRLPYCTRRKRV